MLGTTAEEKKTQQLAAESGGTTAAGNAEIVTPKATPATPAVQTTAQQSGSGQTAATKATTTTTTTTTTPTTSGTRSAAYENAMATLKKAETQAPTYTSAYDTEINEIYNKIINKEPFKYDYSTDPLYNQYKETYTQQGKQAMRDSMAQTAALTGGYGNSYGSTVGQQQYDAYLSRLNDVLPELYGQAYDMYQQEATNLQNQYNLMLERENADYDRYRDALSDYRYDVALDEERANQLASDLAAYGDFSGYGELYGDDAADAMFKAWVAQYPDVAHVTGQITDDQYDNLKNGRSLNDGLDENGKRIVALSSGGGGSSGVSYDWWGNPSYGAGQGGWDPGNHADVNRENYYRVTGEDPWGIYE